MRKNNRTKKNQYLKTQLSLYLLNDKQQLSIYYKHNNKQKSPVPSINTPQSPDILSLIVEDSVNPTASYLCRGITFNLYFFSMVFQMLKRCLLIRFNLLDMLEKIPFIYFKVYDFVMALLCFLKFIINLSRTMENTGKPKGKYTVTQQWYNCVCQKSYRSFSALYLHVKNLHGISIFKSEKEKMKKTVVWCGACKKVTYEFLQSQVDRLKGKVSGLGDDSGKSDQLRQMSPSKQNQLKLRKQESKVEILNDVLAQFKKQSLKNDAELSLQIELYNDVSKEMLKMLRMDKVEETGKELVDKLPLYLNTFVVDHLPSTSISNSYNKTIIELLSRLSQWMFTKGMSKHLAIVNNQ